MAHGVGGIEVLEDRLAAKQLGVEHHGEVDVEDDVVVDGQPKQETDELELLLRLKGGGVEPEEPRHLIVGEQPWPKTQGGREREREADT